MVWGAQVHIAHPLHLENMLKVKMSDSLTLHMHTYISVTKKKKSTKRKTSTVLADD